MDTDPSLSTFGLDVDDDLALLFLLGSPEVELLGVTTVFGNSFGVLTHLSAKKTLESACRTDLSVVRGADSPRDAVGARRAGSALAAFVRAHPEVAEVDVNPVMVYAQGEGAIALDALIVTR